ncbi:unnamed protein product [Parnassius mnemosyne]|uniref:Uncharacterized protein n=1 Tax=Parnassius mnemosyne TaxID=213953 RepID=A0AAV1KVP1_9NEOP
MSERDSATVSDHDITLSLSARRFVSTTKQNSCHYACVEECALKFQRKRDITKISRFGCKDKDATLSPGDARSNIEEATLNVDNTPNKEVDLSVSNSHYFDSTSSSRVSSSSDSSSSSSSSSITSFNEDSDDSVKDPNYEVVEPRRLYRNSSDSDGELVNVNTRKQDGILQETVICTPTEGHEMILNSVLQESDALPILNELSNIENVSPTEQN